MEVQIIDVVSKTAKNGRQMWTVATNQGILSCFEDDVAQGAIENKGKWVDATITESKDKKFKNLVGFSVIEAPVTTPKVVTFEYNESKERRIVRQSCLKAALEIIKEDSWDYEECIKLAELFEKWVYRDA